MHVAEFTTPDHGILDPRTQAKRSDFGSSLAESSLSSTDPSFRIGRATILPAAGYPEHVIKLTGCFIGDGNEEEDGDR